MLRKTRNIHYNLIWQNLKIQKHTFVRTAEKKIQGKFEITQKRVEEGVGL